MGWTLVSWNRRFIGLLGLVTGVLSAAEAPSTSAAPDKSSFNLFAPTPTALMRDLDTDRPDKTESPYTVDAGHYQLEMGLVNYTYDKHNRLPNATEFEAWTIPSINLKAGLLNNLDAQIVLQPYNKVRVHE